MTGSSWGSELPAMSDGASSSHQFQFMLFYPSIDSLCSFYSWVTVLTEAMTPCVFLQSLQSWKLWFALCPFFSYGPKKHCWYFSLLSFLLVMMEWWLLSSLYVEPSGLYFDPVKRLRCSFTQSPSSVLGTSLLTPDHGRGGRRPGVHELANIPVRRAPWVSLGESSQYSTSLTDAKGWLGWGPGLDRPWGPPLGLW